MRLVNNMVLLVVVSLFWVLGGVQLTHATSFTISNINFTDLVGNNERFRWSVAPRGDISFDLSPGESRTFTYGRFSTRDFPINWADGSDNNDRFTSNFDIMPPDPALTLSGIGHPDARLRRGPDFVWVDFNNTGTTVRFGDGGSYRIRFLDTTRLWSDGSLDLRARVRLYSEGYAKPVAEPSTLSLIGCGLLAVGIVGFGLKK